MAGNKIPPYTQLILLMTPFICMQFHLKLIHFAQSFGITPSISKLIQGMWHLDHMEFDVSILDLFIYLFY